MITVQFTPRQLGALFLAFNHLMPRRFVVNRAVGDDLLAAHKAMSRGLLEAGPDHNALVAELCNEPLGAIDLNPGPADILDWSPIKAIQFEAGEVTQ